MSRQILEKHHETGPTTLGRIMACPPSFGLSQGEPERSSDDATEGTMLHQRVCDGLLRDPKYDEGLTDEQLDAVNLCIEFKAEMLPESLESVFLLEQRVELRDDAGLINFGTLDCVGVSTQKVILIDWKFGRKVKEDALVLQVANYAAAAAQSLPMVRAASHLPIEAWVFFPRLRQKLVWRCTTAEQAIGEVAPKVRAVIEAAKNANGTEATPGVWCDYCRHLPNCDAVREAAQLEIAPATSADLADPRKALHLYDLSLVVEKQAKAVREKIRDLLLSRPDAIPGLQLRKRAGKRSVTDAAELRSRLVGPDKLSVVEYMKALVPSVVALEKAFVEKYYDGRGKGNVTKQELKQRFAVIVGELVTKSESKVLTRT